MKINLPFEIGDKVYTVSEDNEVIELTVKRAIILKNKIRIELYWNMQLWNSYYTKDDWYIRTLIKKYKVFLTKEDVKNYLSKLNPI